MSLKKTISEEINSAFLNVDEFAQEIILDDVEMLAIVSELNIEEDIDRNGVSFEGVTLSLDMVFVKVKYQAHKRVLFNGLPWFCLSAKESMGLLTLNLYRERS